MVKVTRIIHVLIVNGEVWEAYEGYQEAEDNKTFYIEHMGKRAKVVKTTLNIKT